MPPETAPGADNFHPLIQEVLDQTRQAFLQCGNDINAGLNLLRKLEVYVQIQSLLDKEEKDGKPASNETVAELIKKIELGATKVH